MAGHSKWAKVKRAKAVTDSRKGKAFSRVAKEITIAAKAGGGDPDMNPRLRTMILKAKGVNMPLENIDRAIKKGTGELEGHVLEQITYEGYAQGGVGLIVEVTTDNKNRAASEVRSTFTKFGGNLAQTGAVSFQFTHCGQFLIAKDKATEDRLMEIALEAGADDIRGSDEGFEVVCPVNQFYTLSTALEKAEIPTESSEIVYLPNAPVPIAEADAGKVDALIEALDSLDDVQNVFSGHEVQG